MGVEFREVADDSGPATAGFGIEGGKATVQFFVDEADLDDAIIELLGDSDVAGNGSIKRRLPKAHGRWPHLYASNISSIVGRKKSEYAEAEPALEAEAMENYGTWEQYLLTVDFTPRPYDLLGDESIEAEEITYYDENNEPHIIHCPNEWDRYTDYDIGAGAEPITAQQGQMQFYTADERTPHGTRFSGFPRMIVPGCSVNYTWFQVPWSYVDSDNSYLIGYQGYINQLDWDGWEAGTLLYLKPQIRRYPPPMPSMVANPNGVGFSRDKRCDVVLQFLYTKRTVISPPTPYNRNWIAAGHNCPPWLTDRTFRYAANTETRIYTGPLPAPDPPTVNPSLAVPTYLSIPFQLLFTDPDYVQ